MKNEKDNHNVFYFVKNEKDNHNFDNHNFVAFNL